jgi:hypothetical protein
MHVLADSLAPWSGPLQTALASCRFAAQHPGQMGSNLRICCRQQASRPAGRIAVLDLTCLAPEKDARFCTLLRLSDCIDREDDIGSEESLQLLLSHPHPLRDTYVSGPS